jgi:DNA-binding transcriptional MocR family regulator
LVLAVTRAIEQQALRPGMAVPSVREFAREHGVSTFTVAAAYNRLVSLGWLAARPGAGYRVAHPASALARVQAPPPRWEPPRMGGEWLLSDIFADHSIPIKSGCGWLPGEWANEDGLHMALRHLARVPAEQLAGYGHPYGYAPLRESIAGGLAAHGLAVTPAQVLLTQGVTHGLDLVVRTLLAPGDTVVVEQPCYANLLQLLRLAGLRLVAVPRTPEGIDCAALEQAMAQHRPRAVFINTVLQNPTGASLTMANAFQVLQICQRHGAWVVEDDISRELASGVAPMLAALDGGQRVVLLGGYSKTISPSVRVGYVAGHPDLVRDLARTKMATGLTSPEIMERIVHQVIREGHYRHHVSRVRERLALAHAHVGQLMAAQGFEVFVEPRAGLFLWARSPAWRGAGANGLARRALADGIWLAPASYFAADDEDSDWVRFNVAYSESPVLWQFMRRTA